MRELSNQYRIWFCDIWGVVHNGVQVFESAVHCLTQHRLNSGLVVLITNSPRTSEGVVSQLLEMGVSDKCWDSVVTSGDVTRSLIGQYGGGRIFHVGPARDFSLFDGLDLQLVTLAECKAVVCTGLFKEYEEQPSDYLPLLREMLARDLTFICANPDKVVRKGDRLLYCAGSIADIYTSLGGRVMMAGKPFAPIYDLAMQRADSPLKDQVMAIGDGLETDIRGAADFGVPSVLITGGINEPGFQVDEALSRLGPGARVLARSQGLAWT
jgi:HAD superfamily hydrolase (TIGR01459 family)